jgi:hypothetical protein
MEKGVGRSVAGCLCVVLSMFLWLFWRGENYSLWCGNVLLVFFFFLKSVLVGGRQGGKFGGKGSLMETRASCL